LTKIASAVFKKAILSNTFHTRNIYGFYSSFESVISTVNCINTINDCHDLKVCSFKIIVDGIADAVIEKALNVGSTSFEIQQLNTELYLASSFTNRFELSFHDFPFFKRNSFNNKFIELRARKFHKF
jgi:hypothetical protein